MHKVRVYGPLDAMVPNGNVVNKGITIRANQASVKQHRTGAGYERLKSEKPEKQPLTVELLDQCDRGDY